MGEEGVTYSLEGDENSLHAATGEEEDHLIPYLEVAEEQVGAKEARLVGGKAIGKHIFCSKQIYTI